MKVLAILWSTISNLAGSLDVVGAMALLLALGLLVLLEAWPDFLALAACRF